MSCSIVQNWRFTEVPSVGAGPKYSSLGIAIRYPCRSETGPDVSGAATTQVVQLSVTDAIFCLLRRKRLKVPDRFTRQVRWGEGKTARSKEGNQRLKKIRTASFSCIR